MIYKQDFATEAVTLNVSCNDTCERLRGSAALCVSRKELSRNYNRRMTNATG